MTARIRLGIAVRAPLACLLVVVAVCGAAVLRSVPARADDIPADPAADGYVGLCGIDDRPMIGGDTHAKPFAWKAIASEPAPAEAQGERTVATLYVYQPRPDVPATDWNGDQLTATSVYSTRQAPTTQATKLDNGLDYVVKDYPPMVDGLYELRMYFGNVRNNAYTDQYAAAFIRVTGDRWTVVQGGTVACGKGHAVSPEVAAIGSSSAAGTPTASAPFGGPAGTGVPTDAHGVPVTDAADPSAAGSGAESGAASDTHSGSAMESGSAPSQSAGLSPGMTISDGSGGAPAASTSAAAATTSAGAASAGWIVAAVLAVIVVGGAGWLTYRRRSDH